MTGTQLLGVLRSGSLHADGLPAVLRHAAFTALLTDLRPGDHDLLVQMVGDEIERVSADPGLGCGEPLHAGCMLLCRTGDPDVIPIIWRAKNLNMDTGSTIDAGLLFPAGDSATLSFARTFGDARLLARVEEQVAIDDVRGPQMEDDHFAGAPDAGQSVVRLADWLA